MGETHDVYINTSHVEKFVIKLLKVYGLPRHSGVHLT